MGGKWDYKHPSDVMVEVARLTPSFAGVTYERLEGYKSLQWPVAKDGTDTPLCYTENFPFPDGKAKFHPARSCLTIVGLGIISTAAVAIAVQNRTVQATIANGRSFILILDGFNSIRT